ncbi:Uncharacterised protein [Streptococcus pneumoniae]|nr:Uncharacterised protein [Streptococcus pneumoniae]
MPKLGLKKAFQGSTLKTDPSGFIEKPAGVFIHVFADVMSTADAVAPSMTKNSEINLINGGSLSAAYT